MGGRCGGPPGAGGPQEDGPLVRNREGPRQPGPASERISPQRPDAPAQVRGSRVFWVRREPPVGDTRENLSVEREAIYPENSSRCAGVIVWLAPWGRPESGPERAELILSLSVPRRSCPLVLVFRKAFGDAERRFSEQPCDRVNDPERTL